MKKLLMALFLGMFVGAGVPVALHADEAAKTETSMTGEHKDEVKPEKKEKKKKKKGKKGKKAKKSKKGKKAKKTATPVAEPSAEATAESTPAAE